jgi:hypothetical protein
MTTLSLEQRILKAATLLSEGKPISYRGASASTVEKVEALARKLKQDAEFPECPCEVCN